MPVRRGNGKQRPPVSGTILGNVIFWDASPQMTRPKFSKAKMQFFDQPSATWKDKTIDTGLDGAKAVNEVRTSAADEE